MKTLLNVLQLSIAMVGILPFCFPKEDFAAWQTGAREKLSRLAQSAANHAGAAWAAGIAAVAALAAFIGHNLPIFIRAGESQLPTIRQHPQEAMSGLLSILSVLGALVGIFLAYIAIVLLVYLVCHVIASHEKGITGGVSVVLNVIISVIRLST